MPPQQKFGEILIEKGVVTWDQVNEALRFQETTMPGHKIGIILICLRYIVKEDIVDVLRIQKPNAPEAQIREEVYVFPEPPTANVLAIKLPHYEMPGPPYDDLVKIQDGHAPKHGVVFPPAPKDKSTESKTEK